MTGVKEVGTRPVTHHWPTSTEPDSQGTLRLGLSSPHLYVIGWDKLVADWDRAVIGSDSAVSHRAPRGMAPSLRKRLDGWCEWCHSETVFSLPAYQIFTMISYSRLTVWQKCIMWTSWSRRGDIGSWNNRLFRKMETNQMYQWEKNYRKLLILVLSGPQSSSRICEYLSDWKSTMLCVNAKALRWGLFIWQRQENIANPNTSGMFIKC